MRRTSPQERLDEAWRRMDGWDYAGARLLAAEALRDDPSLEVEVTYATGVAYELERQHEDALEIFEGITTTWPDHRRAIDARFRIALTLADAGAPKAALRALKKVGHWKKLEGEAAWKVQLSEATWLLEAGKVRKGIRSITEALDTLPAGELSWFAARARSAVLHQAVQASKGLDFDVPERKVKSRLDARATYILAARHELGELASLQETYFILHGFRELGDAYLALGDDFLASPPPRKLSETQATLYADGLRRKADMQFVKARRLYDLGLEHAGRMGWRGPELATLEARLLEAEARVEASASGTEAP